MNLDFLCLKPRRLLQVYSMGDFLAFRNVSFVVGAGVMEFAYGSTLRCKKIMPLRTWPVSFGLLSLKSRVNFFTVFLCVICCICGGLLVKSYSKTSQGEGMVTYIF